MTIALFSAAVIILAVIAFELSEACGYYLSLLRESEDKRNEAEAGRERAEKDTRAIAPRCACASKPARSEFLLKPDFGFNEAARKAHLN